MNGAVIYDGIRSPFGRYGGSLSAERPNNLATSVIMALLDRSGIESSLVENVIFGNTSKACEACRNVGRNAALLAGMHTSVGGVTVNRLSGSHTGRYPCEQLRSGAIVHRRWGRKHESHVLGWLKLLPQNREPS